MTVPYDRRLQSLRRAPL